MHRIARALSNAHLFCSEVADEFPPDSPDGQKVREVLTMLEWMQDRLYTGRRLPDALLSMMNH